MSVRKKKAADTRIADSILEIGRRCAALPDHDTRTADEILGYNEFGALKGSMNATEADELRARVKQIRKSWR